MVSSSFSGNQWYFNGQPIPGATGRKYKPTATGSYTVSSIVSGCYSPQSNSISYTIVSLNDPIDDAVISVSPNPATSAITISYSGSPTFLVTIYNGQGQIVTRKKMMNGDKIQIGHLSAGVYVVKIEDVRRSKTYTRNLVKV